MNCELNFFVFYSCFLQKFFDTFEYARDIDLAKYSIFIACGGDESVHDVTNGMMARKDGLKYILIFIKVNSVTYLFTVGR